MPQLTLSKVELLILNEALRKVDRSLWASAPIFVHDSDSLRRKVAEAMTTKEPDDTRE